MVLRWTRRDHLGPPDLVHVNLQVPALLSCWISVTVLDLSPR